MIRPNDDEIAFKTSIRLLRELHQLIAADRGDSCDADAIRDEMDVPWARLTEEQRQLVRGLSEDLYSIGEQRAVAEVSAADAPPGYEDAVNRKDWRESLRVLRENVDRIPPPDVAYARGVAWAQLGCPEIALMFFRELERLGPLQPLHEFWMINCAIESGEFAGEVTRAERIAKRADNYLLLFKAAEVLSLAADSNVGQSQCELRRTAIDTAQKAFGLLKLETDTESIEYQTAQVLCNPASLNLASNFLALGDTQSAIDACKKAAAFDPDDPISKIILAFFELGNDPSVATRVPEIRDAIRNLDTGRTNTSYPVPICHS